MWGIDRWWLLKGKQTWKIGCFEKRENWLLPKVRDNGGKYCLDILMDKGVTVFCFPEKKDNNISLHIFVLIYWKIVFWTIIFKLGKELWSFDELKK